MRDQSALHDLLERIRNADRPDRELDAALFTAFPDPQWPRTAYREENCLRLTEFGRHPRFHDGWWLTRKSEGDLYPEDLPRLSASLDAALALVERVRPGCDIDFATRETMMDGRVMRTADVTIYGRAYSDEKDATAYADSPALALLAALVAAEMEEDNNV